MTQALHWLVPVAALVLVVALIVPPKDWPRYATYAVVAAGVVVGLALVGLWRRLTGDVRPPPRPINPDSRRAATEQAIRDARKDADRALADGDRAELRRLLEEARARTARKQEGQR